MRKFTLTTLLYVYALISYAQQSNVNSANYEIGNGINFNFNDGDYQFNIFGFIKPSYIYGEENIYTSDGQTNNIYRQFKSQNSNLFFTGKAAKEKLGFKIQMDYSSSNPLVEAYISYFVNNKITFHIGQMQVGHNNLEMTHNEDMLRFTNRGMLSQTYTQQGEEFGVFLESNFGSKFVINPTIALTSGDGRNSFGEDSRDSDKGGVKIGSRVNIFPFGNFSEGNGLTTVDILREEELKAQFGFAYSKNFGASNMVGDGHGDFIIYDDLGNESYPDYSQLFFDVNLKYKGFSILFEYADSFASGLDNLYVDPNGFSILEPTQISEYLVLGESIGLQFGYFSKNKYSLDFIFEKFKPEFNNRESAVSREFCNKGIGISKYLEGNNLKFQISAFETKYKNFDELDDNKFFSLVALAQVRF